MGVPRIPKDGSDLAATEKEQLFQRKAEFHNKEETMDIYHYRIFWCIFKIIPNNKTILVILPSWRFTQALFPSFASN